MWVYCYLYEELNEINKYDMYQMPGQLQAVLVKVYLHESLWVPRWAPLVVPSACWCSKPASWPAPESSDLCPVPSHPPLSNQGEITCTYTRCVCETQIPQIMANSIDGQDHKDKYFDTSKKILSQEMTMCNMETVISYLF